MIEYFKKGSGIHINPKNKGKLTETMRRTGKTAEELTHSKNPITRKRALFAVNAKKFKHEFGAKLVSKAEGGIKFSLPLVAGQLYDRNGRIITLQGSNLPVSYINASAPLSAVPLYVIVDANNPDYYLGKFMLNNPSVVLLTTDGTRVLPELEVVGTQPEYYYMDLRTFYPGKGRYPFTGHSEISVRKSNTPASSRKPGTITSMVSTTSNNKGYSIVTNNCSDDTGRVMQYFNDLRGGSLKFNPWFFTTPGDVRDYFIELGAEETKTDPDSFSKTDTISLTKEEFELLNNYIKSKEYKKK